MCECAPAVTKLEKKLEADYENLYERIEATKNVLADRISTVNRHCRQRSSASERRAREKLETERRERDNRIAMTSRRNRKAAVNRLSEERARVRSETQIYIDARLAGLTSLNNGHRRSFNRCKGPAAVDYRCVDNDNGIHYPSYHMRHPGKLYRSRSDETISTQLDHRNKCHPRTESRYLEMESGNLPEMNSGCCDVELNHSCVDTLRRCSASGLTARESGYYGDSGCRTLSSVNRSATRLERSQDCESQYVASQGRTVDDQCEWIRPATFHEDTALCFEPHFSSPVSPSPNRNGTSVPEDTKKKTNFVSTEISDDYEVVGFHVDQSKEPSAVLPRYRSQSESRSRPRRQLVSGAIGDVPIYLPLSHSSPYDQDMSKNMSTGSQIIQPVVSPISAPTVSQVNSPQMMLDGSCHNKLVACPQTFSNTFSSIPQSLLAGSKNVPSENSPLQVMQNSPGYPVAPAASPVSICSPLIFLSAPNSPLRRPPSINLTSDKALSCNNNNVEEPVKSLQNCTETLAPFQHVSGSQIYKRISVLPRGGHYQSAHSVGRVKSQSHSVPDVIAKWYEEKRPVSKPQSVLPAHSTSSHSIPTHSVPYYSVPPCSVDSHSIPLSIPFYSNSIHSVTSRNSGSTTVSRGANVGSTDVINTRRGSDTMHYDSNGTYFMPARFNGTHRIPEAYEMEPICYRATDKSSQSTKHLVGVENQPLAPDNFYQTVRPTVSARPVSLYAPSKDQQPELSATRENRLSVHHKSRENRSNNALPIVRSIDSKAYLEFGRSTAV